MRSTYLLSVFYASIACSTASIFSRSFFPAMMSIGNETTQDFDTFSTFSNSSTLYDSKDPKSLTQQDATEHERPDRGRLNKAFDSLRRKRLARPISAIGTSQLPQDSAKESSLPGMDLSRSSTLNDNLSQDSAHQDYSATSKKVPRGKLLDKLKGSKTGKKANQDQSSGTVQNKDNVPLTESGPAAGSAGNSPLPPGEGPGKSSSVSDTNTPLLHTIVTKFGTTDSDFQKFVADTFGVQDVKVDFPNIGFQAYRTKLRPSQTAAIERHPIVWLVMEDEWKYDEGSEEYYNAVPRIEPRAGAPPNPNPNPKGEGSAANKPLQLENPKEFSLYFQDQSPDHLKIISQGPIAVKSRKAAKGNEEGKGKEKEHGSDLQPYMLSPKAGEGVTIYVIDGGLNPAHPDFAKSYNPNKFYIVPDKDVGPHPKTYRGKEYKPDPENVMMNRGGHGHCMASLAAGAVHGVSKKAKVVPVKYKYQIGAVTDVAILKAFGYIINQVKNSAEHSKPGSAVINLSGGYSRQILSDEKKFERRKELLDGLLKQCWDLDIVTVIAAGNDGRFQTRDLKDEIPACLGKKDNPLITVGAATVDGKRHHLTTQQREGAGSITVWAKGDMPTYCAAMEGTGSQAQEGSSVAAAQISGLAAYFLSLDRNELPIPKGWPVTATEAAYGFGPDLHVKGKVAQTVKDYIVAMSHKYSEGEDSVNMAYNGAEDKVCKAIPANNIVLKRATAPKKDAYGLTPFIVSGKLVGNRPGMSFCPARSSTASRNSKTASRTKTGSSKPTSRSRTATYAVTKSSGRPLKSTAARARQVRATALYNQIKKNKE